MNRDNHYEENKLWRLIRILSLIGIIISLMLSSILLISGKINKKGILPIKEITIEDKFRSASGTFYEFSDIQKIEQIAQTIAKSHKYKLNVFDCTDFTKSLVGNLTKSGYDARCIMGYKKQNPKQVFHAWTEVNLSGEIIWIESTTGEIVTEENKPYYKPLKGYKKYRCF